MAARETRSVVPFAVTTPPLRRGRWCASPRSV